MFFRMLVFVISMCVVGYFLMSYFTAGNKVEEKMNQSTAMQEQKKALEGAGVDAGDKKAVNKALQDQIQSLQAYQKQADDLQEQGQQ